LQIEYGFTLPRGYIDEAGTLHRDGVMRLARALDEVAPFEDKRASANEAYLSILLLSRVLVRLGNISPVSPAVIEKLFASDFSYLQQLYVRRRTESSRPHARRAESALGSICYPSCLATMPAIGKRHCVPEGNTNSGHQASDASPEKSPGGVDIEKLADRVCQLMMREIRLDLARTGRVINRRES
jgi:hypothetical protein